MEMKSLGELGILFTGKRPKYIKQYYEKCNSENGIKITVLDWSSIRDLVCDNYLHSEKDYMVTKKFIDRNKKHIIIPGDIVFNTYPSKKKLNVVYIDEYNMEKYIYGDSLGVLRNKSNYSSKYIYIIITFIFQKFIELHKCSHNKKVKLGELAKIKIPFDNNSMLDIISKYEELEKDKKELLAYKKVFNEKLANLMN